MSRRAVVDEAPSRWFLEDQREFLERSLADAEREHDAGDLSDEDFRVLTDRDRARLFEVEQALATMDQADSATEVVGDDGAGGGEAASPGDVVATREVPGRRSEAPGGVTVRAARRRRRTVFLGVAVAAVVAGVVVLLIHVMSPRLPGQASSGTVTLSGAQQIQRELAQAAVLEDQGSFVQALKLYQQVLNSDPQQPVALAERGWLEYEAGVASNNQSLIKKGRSSVLAAVHADPNGYAGHLYLGTIELLQDGDPQGAVAQYRLFLSEHPPRQLLDSAASYLRQAFAQDNQPVPSQVPAATSPSGSASSSSPSSSSSP